MARPFPSGPSLFLHSASRARRGHRTDGVASFAESWPCCPSSTCGANDYPITPDASSLALPEDFVASWCCAPAAHHVLPHRGTGGTPTNPGNRAERTPEEDAKKPAVRGTIYTTTTGYRAQP